MYIPCILEQTPTTGIIYHVYRTETGVLPIVYGVMFKRLQTQTK